MYKWGIILQGSNQNWGPNGPNTLRFLIHLDSFEATQIRVGCSRYDDRPRISKHRSNAALESPASSRNWCVAVRTWKMNGSWEVWSLQMLMPWKLIWDLDGFGNWQRWGCSQHFWIFAHVFVCFCLYKKWIRETSRTCYHYIMGELVRSPFVFTKVLALRLKYVREIKRTDFPSPFRVVWVSATLSHCQGHDDNFGALLDPCWRQTCPSPPWCALQWALCLDFEHQVSTFHNLSVAYIPLRMVGIIMYCITA